jgi:hypothetical protein
VVGGHHHRDVVGESVPELGQGRVDVDELVAPAAVDGTEEVAGRVEVAVVGVDERGSGARRGA